MGEVNLSVRSSQPSKFTINIRIPAWTGLEPISGDLYSYTDKTSDKVNISVNGKPIDYTINKGYAIISRQWISGDKININLPLRVRSIIARNEVGEDQKKTGNFCRANSLLFGRSGQW